MAIDGQYIIGTLIKDKILRPFLEFIGGKYTRVKINKHTGETVPIPNDAPPEERDQLNDRFFKFYKDGYIYEAKPTFLAKTYRFFVDIAEAFTDPYGRKL